MGGRSLNDAVPAVLFALFVVLVAIPVGFSLGGALFAGKIKEAFTPATWFLLAKSGLLAALAATLSTLTGLLLAFLLYKTRPLFSTFFKIALLIPLFLAPYILAVAWKDLFFLVFGSSRIIATGTGFVLFMTTVYTPLAMLITGSALQQVGASPEEAGLMAVRPWRVVLKIVLPLIKPAVFTAWVLVFVFSVSQFSVPAYFGLRLFTTEIFTQFSAFYNHAVAMLQSLLLIVVCVLLLWSEKEYLAEAPFLSVGGKGSYVKKYCLKGAGRWLYAFLPFWLALTVLLPFSVLLWQASRGGIQTIERALRLLLPTFPQSLGLALAGAALITVIGMVSAYGAVRRKTSVPGRWFETVLLLLFSVPSVILGIGLIKFYNRPFWGFIYGGYGLILIGYAAKFSFIASKIVDNAIKQLPVSLEEAAETAGVGRRRILLEVVLPLLLPAVSAAFLTAFLFSFGELGTTIMLYPPGTELLPVKVFTIMANAPQSLVSAMTLIVFFITLFMIMLFYYLGKRIGEKYGFVYG